MHVLVLQTGVRAALIYGDSDHEGQRESPLGISGHIWAVSAHRVHFTAPKAAFMEPKGHEEVSLSLSSLLGRV